MTKSSILLCLLLVGCSGIGPGVEKVTVYNQGVVIKQYRHVTVMEIDNGTLYLQDEAGRSITVTGTYIVEPEN